MKKVKHVDSSSRHREELQRRGDLSLRPVILSAAKDFVLYLLPGLPRPDCIGTRNDIKEEELAVMARS